MQPFEIFNAGLTWRGCEDMRPWIIIQVRPGDLFGCFPISSNCYGGSSCFELHAGHPDFPATGLAKSCFIHDDHLFDIPRLNLARRRGELTGQLLTEFRAFAGI